ncbi:TPA: transposase [Salmonella enterica subsp. enterica serovar Kottbus]
MNVYCTNGCGKIDNYIAENTLWGVTVRRKNRLFVGSDRGSEDAAVLYLLSICTMQNQKNDVIKHIQ